MRFLPASDSSIPRFPATFVSVSLVFLSGCAHQSPAQPPSEASLCASLQEVVAQADNGFEKLKRTPTLNPLSGVTKWETAQVFPDSQCDVIQWAGGRVNYICTWREGTEDASRQTYRKNVDLMGRCLGKSWAPSESSGQTGTATAFTKAGESTHVVMRYFRPRRGYSPAWETSLVIGDEITGDAR